jgi:GNAT superfamily N-acetyltransferase
MPYNLLVARAAVTGYMVDVRGTITIRDLHDSERAWANAQYRAIRFATTPPGAIALVAERGGARVGLGRLVTHAPGVLELGGIWTDEAARGHGVARTMVAALLGRLASPRVWCIPFTHLAAFYQSFGFAPSPPPWPSTIATKVADCAMLALPDVVVLVR